MAALLTRKCLLSASLGAMVRPRRADWGRLVRPMTLSLRLLLVVTALFAATGARAHPHVWVTMTSELVYAPDGSVTGVRHAWTFDDMFSTFATQGLESKEKGKFTREELAPLAQVNVESLKDFDYFTVAQVNGKKTDLNAPVDYWLEFTDGLLRVSWFFRNHEGLSILANLSGSFQKRPQTCKESEPIWGVAPPPNLPPWSVYAAIEAS